MKNQGTLVGFLLLFGLWMGYVFLSQPSQEEIDKYNKQVAAYKDSLQRDSIERARIDSTSKAKLLAINSDSSLTQTQKDSIFKTQQTQLTTGLYGVFAKAANDSSNQTVSIENEFLKLTFNSKGGRITEVDVKGFQKYDHRTANKSGKLPVKLMNHANNRFDYLIPMANVQRGNVSTRDLQFKVSKEGDKTLVFRAYTDDSTGFIEQKYTLQDKYTIDYNLTLNGLQAHQPRTGNITLNWDSYLDKIEKNDSYERSMSSVHYKLMDNSPSYCNCASNANDNLNNSVQWVSHAQQFFNTTLLAENGTAFKSAELKTVMTAPEFSHLKELYTVLTLPMLDQPTATYDMKIYVGPNIYTELSAMNAQVERIIPFGWSIFGAINRYLILPLFNFLAGIIPSYGLIILLLTLLIRIVVYPLQRKMLVSGVKMSILKPELDKLRERHKDNPQQQQLEQMKMMQQYGVSPLGGCLPMLLTMPIWVALYRFFPASIEFRQQGFLWADDLVSYDSILDFGFYIPVYGDHISLFTLLWMISMFAFLWYNSKQMDMSSMAANNPNMKIMKIMQYAFPVIFFFALNSWASGLTAYMLFSNLLNILQTYVTKNFLINKEKLQASMEATRVKNQNNPKGGGMWEQYEKMMKQQQEKRNNKK